MKYTYWQIWVLPHTNWKQNSFREKKVKTDKAKLLKFIGSRPGPSASPGGSCCTLAGFLEVRQPLREWAVSPGHGASPGFASSQVYKQSESSELAQEETDAGLVAQWAISVVLVSVILFFFFAVWCMQWCMFIHACKIFHCIARASDFFVTCCALICTTWPNRIPHTPSLSIGVGQYTSVGLAMWVYVLIVYKWQHGTKNKVEFCRKWVWELPALLHQMSWVTWSS